MNPHQEKIYESKRTFLYYHTRQQKKILIPDTLKARQKAIKNGAVAFDTLSFFRHPDKKFPPPRKSGDCYIVIRDEEDNNDATKSQRHRFIKEIIFRFLTYHKINLQHIAFNKHNFDEFGFQIPSWLLGLENGHFYLTDIYRHIAIKLTGVCKYSYGLKDFTIKYNSLIEADMSIRCNRPKILTAEEFTLHNYKDFMNLSIEPHEAIHFSQPQEPRRRQRIIMDIILKVFKNGTQKEIFSRHTWPPSIPLKNDYLVAKSSPATIKCALMIFRKVTDLGIWEFQARDAHRLVRGTFKKIDEVKRGLDMLAEHHFLLRSDFPRYSYPGRRPSEWYIVNPTAAITRIFQ